MTGVSEDSFEIVALICVVMIAISSGAESFLHFVERFIEHNNWNLLHIAFKKLKNELMIDGTLNILLTLFENKVSKIENLHEIHTLLFLLPVAHTFVCVFNVVVARARMRRLEDTCVKMETIDVINDRADRRSKADEQEKTFLYVVTKNDKHFLTGRYLGQSFCQQFNSVTDADFMALKYNFSTTHCKSKPDFDFRTYMDRVLEDYFKQGVDISLYLWTSVVIFLALDIHGGQAHFWISFIPVIALLVPGAILKHIITEIPHKVVARHASIKKVRDETTYVNYPSYSHGDSSQVISLEIEKLFKEIKRLQDLEKSYYHMWFWRRTFLGLIHFALFLSTLEIAFVSWILVTNRFDTGITGQLPSIVLRLIIGVSVIVVGSYSTLPLYAAVSQMGTDCKKEIFKEVSEDWNIWDIDDPGFD